MSLFRFHSWRCLDYNINIKIRAYSAIVVLVVDGAVSSRSTSAARAAYHVLFPAKPHFNTRIIVKNIVHVSGKLWFLPLVESAGLSVGLPCVPQQLRIVHTSYMLMLRLQQVCRADSLLRWLHVALCDEFSILHTWYAAVQGLRTVAWRCGCARASSLR